MFHPCPQRWFLRFSLPFPPVRATLPQFVFPNSPAFRSRSPRTSHPLQASVSAVHCCHCWPIRNDWVGSSPVFPFSTWRPPLVPRPVSVTLTSLGFSISYPLCRTISTINGPTPLIAAYFIILAEIIRRLGPCYSRLKPRLCTFPPESFKG